MKAPAASIVMTAYRRSCQLRRTLESIAAQPGDYFEVIVVEDGDADGGETRLVCQQAPVPVRYFQRKNRPNVPYSNQAAPLNIGIRQARGEVVILQNAECLHASPNVIDALTLSHPPGTKRATFASVLRLKPDGSPDYWGSHPEHGVSPYFYCGSIRREVLMQLRGLDEDFIGWGAEDDDLAARLRVVGVSFRFLSDVIVHHQWHQEAPRYGRTSNIALYEQKFYAMQRGEIGPERNLGREWGTA